jgi:hypothetical protein
MQYMNDRNRICLPRDLISTTTLFILFYSIGVHINCKQRAYMVSKKVNEHVNIVELIYENTISEIWNKIEMLNNNRNGIDIHPFILLIEAFIFPPGNQMRRCCSDWYVLKVALSTMTLSPDFVVRILFSFFSRKDWVYWQNKGDNSSTWINHHSKLYYSRGTSS